MTENNEYPKYIVSVEDVSFYGLHACLVTYRDNYYGSLSPQVLYIEDSIKPLYEKHGITSLEELPDLNLPAIEGRREIEMPDDDVTIIGTKEDKEWIDSVAKDFDDIDDDDFFSDDEEYDDFLDDTLDLNSLRERFTWHDAPYITDSGRQGIQNCWCEKLSPAYFEECCPAVAEVLRAVPVKMDGRWALADREEKGRPMTIYVCDSIEEGLGGVFIMSMGGLYGIHDGNGEEVIPIEMDDISECGYDKIYLTKRQGKFGFRFNNGVYIAPCVDEIAQPEDDYAPYRFRIGDDWKYLSEEGEFTDELEGDTLRSGSLDFTGRISHKNILEDK